MNKPWKIKTCETCENQISWECRLNPPVPRQSTSLFIGQYPVVNRKFKHGDPDAWLSACSKYEEVA